MRGKGLITRLCWRGGIVILAGVAAATSAFGFTCRDMGGDMHVTFPAVVALRAGVAPGALLTDFVQADGAMRWECTYDRHEHIGVFINSLRSDVSGQHANVNGVGYAVYATGLPEVGMLIELTTALESSALATEEGVLAMTGVSHQLGRTASVAGVGTGTPSQATLRIQRVRLALVRLAGGRLTAGTLQGGVVGQAGIALGAANTSSAMPVLQMTHQITYSTVQFVAPTCSVPDVTVIMPPYALSRFKGIQSIAGQWQPFLIHVQDCPAGIRSLHYRFNRPNTGMLDEVNQAMRGKNGLSAAKGIGIQLSGDDNVLIRFGADRTYVSQQLGLGGAFAIPFAARYVKPAGMLATAGSVRAAVTFELNYE